MRSIHTLLLSFLLLTLAFLGVAASDERADQLVVKHLDVTGNGIDDEIRPNIKGENWNAQLNRTLTTAAQGKIIFKHSARPSSTRNLDTLTLSSS